MSGLNASKILLEMLRGYGVEHVFGLPGETTLPLYSEWIKAESPRHLMVRDERTAVFAADAYARLRFRPGVCEGPSVGATHMIPGAAEAYRSGVPMILITSEIPLRYEKRNMLTGIDQSALFRGVTKETLTVTDAAELPNLIRRAFRLATTGRPGPVHIRFPSDAQAEEVPEPLLHAQRDFAVYPGHRYVAEAGKIREALEVLGRAERPVMILGQGALFSQAWEEARELAEIYAVPVGTTINGKGAFSDLHPLGIGVTGARGGTNVSNRVVSEADVILYVGCSADSAGTDGWKLPPEDTKAKIIHLDVSEAEPGNVYPTEVTLIGDAKATLRAMIDAAAAKPRAFRESPRIQAIRRELEEYRSYAASLGSSDAAPVHPLAFIRELDAAMPRGSVVITDVGTPGMYTATYLPVREAGRSMIYNYAMGSLGFALPASIGAVVARPGASVATLVGDGSFGFAAGELETVARLGGPNHIVVFNNLSYGWIRAEWALSYGRDYVDWATNFKPIDYVKVSEGFGVPATRVEKTAQLRQALTEAFRSREPTFTEVVTLPEDKLIPPVPSWIRKAEQRGLDHIR